MDKPALLLQHPIDCFAIDYEVIPESQLHPEPPIPERGMHLNPVAQAFHPRGIGLTTASRRPSDSVQAGPTDTQHLTAATF